MSYVPPTPADFKTRFPAFASVADATIQLLLDEAALMVDDTWVSQADFTLGRMLYAAHYLTLDGAATGGSSSTEAQLLGFQSIRMGPLELTRFKGSDASAGSWGSTSYGTRFLELVRRNSPAVAVV